MFRKFALTLIALGCVMLGSASAYFEWTEVTELDSNKKETKVIYARVSPDVYDQLLKTGLNATTGTSSTSPAIQAGGPGASKLMLGSKMYKFAGSNGTAQVGDMKIYVLKFTPARPDNFAGKWATNYGPMTLSQSGNKVTGTYNQDAGKTYTLSGTVKDGVLTGKYSQPGYPNPAYREGPFTFTLSGDGASFTGKCWDNQGKVEAAWNGKQAAEKKP